MTDNVCDSWEDVDVDNIVIKPAAKLKNPKPVQLDSTFHNSSSSANSSFNIEENGGNVVVNSTSGPSQAASAFKILQRVPSANAAPFYPASLKQSQPPQVSTLYSSVAASAASPFDSQPKVVVENSTRTQFVAPLRILNRPNSNRDQAKDPRSNVDVNKQLLKSFEEKQAEYAKARLRILGEEMPAENLNLTDIKESLDQVSGGQSSDKISPSTSNKSSNNTSPSKPLISNPAAIISSSNNPDVIIIREPAVPDGTRGFRYVR